ncbi:MULTISPECIES: hypothetical protein [Streptomyces]|uniref:hypothetical protein n=1 Tax=Streptomyces TaxID=1883 RepID=UPI001C7DF069|nr:hypothetical protein [Streptomyces geysiriensis]MBX4176437.1 hypothetical protein [Streptomyces geysiriensis]
MIDVLPADLSVKVYDIVTMLDALERALATQRPAWPGGEVRALTGRNARNRVLKARPAGHGRLPGRPRSFLYSK